MAFDVEQAFGELRSLVHGSPSVPAFAEVCGLAQEVEEAAPGLFAARMLEYAQSHLRAWPTRCVTLRVPYTCAGDLTKMAWAPLVRGVVVTEGFGMNFDLGAYFEQVRMLDWCAHLSLHRLSLFDDVMRRQVDEGLFDGRRSLGPMNIDLETLIEALTSREAAQGIDAIHVVGFKLSDEVLDRFVESGLAGRLRALTVGGGFRRRVTQGEGDGSSEVALFERLEQFERLERLELVDMELTDADAIALASARVPETLRYVGMGGNHLGSGAIRAWVEAGRVGWWLDRDGPVTLNTSRFRFDEGALRACAESGLFDGVERWSCDLDDTTRVAGAGSEPVFATWAPLRDRPQALSRLRELDMRFVPMTPQLSEEVLTTLERAPLTRVRLRPADDALFEAALKAPWAERVEEVHFREHPHVHGERALRALLAWPSFSRVAVLEAKFEVDAAVREEVDAPDVFFVKAPDGRYTVQVRRSRRALGRGVCVNMDGVFQKAWVRGWRARKAAEE